MWYYKYHYEDEEKWEQKDKILGFTAVSYCTSSTESTEIFASETRKDTIFKAFVAKLGYFGLNKSIPIASVKK